MRIGFIGNMGSEMARHLLAAGHTITGYARGVARSCANAALRCRSPRR
ncbi:MAG: NAD(P)-binding domain-containing protein [Gallionella sp.]